MTYQRAASIVAAAAIQGLIIMSIVLSTIGVSPVYRPSPGSPSTGPIPAPMASGPIR